MGLSPLTFVLSPDHGSATGVASAFRARAVGAVPSRLWIAPIIARWARVRLRGVVRRSMPPPDRMLVPNRWSLVRVPSSAPERSPRSLRRTSDAWSGGLTPRIRAPRPFGHSWVQGFVRACREPILAHRDAGNRRPWGYRPPHRPDALSGSQIDPPGSAPQGRIRCGPHLSAVAHRTPTSGREARRGAGDVTPAQALRCQCGEPGRLAQASRDAPLVRKT
jgi:hypothetical protein